MTLEDARRVLEWIEAHQYDDAAAHSTEDALWARVLRAIAAGAVNGQELAAEALKSQEIGFSRWGA